ncbi:MAG TPA: cupredoxin domain-containing protein [Solirubrobacterales bacterium]
MPGITGDNRSGQPFVVLLSIFALLLSMGALLAVAFKLNSDQSPARAQAKAPAASATSARSSTGAGVQNLTVNIKSDEEHGKRGSDGNWHDAFLPADYSVKAGATVKMTFYNYDDMPHTFTSSELGTNVTIPAGSKDKPGVTTVTFHAPQKAGTYQWYCSMPCDPWAMGQDGYMRGFVKVT